MGQKSCKLDPGSRSALNIEIGGSGGRAPDAHPHNFAQRSKDACKFYLQNIVLLPTGEFRLPDESRPLAPPAVRAGGGRDLQHAPKQFSTYSSYLHAAESGFAWESATQTQKYCVVQKDFVRWRSVPEPKTTKRHSDGRRRVLFGPDGERVGRGAKLFGAKIATSLSRFRVCAG